VIVSAGGEVSDVRRVVRPVVVNDPASRLYYIDFSSAPLAPRGPRPRPPTAGAKAVSAAP